MKDKVIENKEMKTESKERKQVKKTVKYVHVTEPKLNVRSKGTKDSSVLSIVTKDTKLKVDETFTSDNWTKVTTPDGIEGYVMTEFVK